MILVINVKKFKPTKSEKTVISIRIDNDLLNLVDKMATKTNISRNELIIQCIDYALDNTKKESDIKS